MKLYFVLVLVFVLSSGSAQESAGEERSVCLLPPDSGICNSETKNETSKGGEFQRRFYFSALNYKCSEFAYSGCGGNGNNFPSEEECVTACSSGKKGEFGDWENIKLAGQRNECWYKGKFYSPGQRIEGTSEDNACSLGCICSQLAKNVPARIHCAQVDCPPPPSNRTNCVPIYGTKNTCCPVSYSCQDDQKTSEFRCKYGKDEYVEGEIIYPEDYPCFRCKCGPKFKGTVDTRSCEEIDCGISLHNQELLAKDCRPEYWQQEGAGSKGLCCPVSWNCPQKEQQQQQQPQQTNNTSPIVDSLDNGDTILEDSEEIFPTLETRQ